MHAMPRRETRGVLQSIPGAVMRVFKSTVDELTGEVERSDDGDADFGVLAGHHLKPAPPERVAAVCVQFFLRMAAAQPDRALADPDASARSPDAVDEAAQEYDAERDGAEALAGEGLAGQGQLLAGAAVAGKYAASIARLPRLMVYCLMLLTV